MTRAELERENRRLRQLLDMMVRGGAGQVALAELYGGRGRVGVAVWAPDGPDGSVGDLQRQLTGAVRAVLAGMGIDTPGLDITEGREFARGDSRDE